MTISEVREAYEKAREWLAVRAVAGGDFERDGLTYRGLFKAPLALGRIGLVSAANRSLDVLRDRMMTPEGDYEDATPDTHPAPSLGYFYTYRATWIAIGAHRLGRYDIAHKTGPFFLSFQDPASGGFYSSGDRSPARRDLCGTGQAAMAALALGACDAAEHAGAFLLRMLEIQPDEDRFHYVLDEKDGFAEPGPDDPAGYFIFLKNEPGQISYPLGLALAALARLYQASGEEHYLAGANAYFDILTNAHEEVYTDPASGKLARGASVLYDLTGEDRYRAASLRAAANLCDLINRDPIGHIPEWYPDPADEPETVRYEILFEYIHALSIVLQFLEDAPGAGDES